MEFVVKEFEQLTTTQLYEILKARCGVFVVEQKMNCQDMDDVDYRSVHIYLQENNDVVAYLRAFFTQESTGEMQIGRCLTVVHGQGLGRKLMEQAIQVLKEQYHCRKIVLHAQKHAIGFYQKFGFEVISEEFLEEGVIHRSMELSF